MKNLHFLLIFMFSTIFPIGTYGQSSLDAQFSLVEILLLDSYKSSNSHKDVDGHLYEGRSKTYDLTLKKGWEYAIVAVCDEDCDDIELYLYDENNNLIDSDTEDDSIPIVNATPRWTGNFEVKIVMYSCSIEPCKYALRVYAK